jgi:hypothetical protein
MKGILILSILYVFQVSAETKSKESTPSNLADKSAPVKAIPAKKTIPVKATATAKGASTKINWDYLTDYDLKTKKVGAKLSAVLGKVVNLTGFMVPLDYNAKEVKEFLLVPYIPSCSHVPPPPDNQIVMVTMKNKNAIKPSYNPVKVEGVMTLKKVDPKAPKKSETSFLPEATFEIKATIFTEVKE